MCVRCMGGHASVTSQRCSCGHGPQVDPAATPPLLPRQGLSRNTCSRRRRRFLWRLCWRTAARPHFFAVILAALVREVARRDVEDLPGKIQTDAHEVSMRCETLIVQDLVVSDAQHSSWIPILAVLGVPVMPVLFGVVTLLIIQTSVGSCRLPLPSPIAARSCSKCNCRRRAAGRPRRSQCTPGPPLRLRAFLRDGPLDTDGAVP